MVDDMGYSDLGAYGSEINTPNIDKLAFEGIRLKEFYNNSICAPTRASLITGQYPHKAGVGYFDIDLGLPPYQGFLNKESLTFGEVLKTAGYNTFLSGKWHVGKDKSVWPTQRGFDQFYGILGGAYTAPHWPLQALPEDIAKYKGKYDLDEKQTIAEKDTEIPEWDNLTYDEKELWKAKMEVYAAMLDRVDQGIDNGAPVEDVAHWGDKVGKNSGPVGTSGSFESQ
eukprot:gene39602-48213_t